MPGAGCVDLPLWMSIVDEAGYTGPIEVEIFNESIWERPLDELVRLTKERFVEVS